MISVIKVGGALIDDGAALERLARYVATRPARSPVVLVHGGGQRVADLQAAYGQSSRTVDGLRVTDANTMPLVEMALSGDVNKRLVRALLAGGAEAIGMSGVDRGLLRCAKLEHEAGDLGLVGRIVHVRTEVLRDLIRDGVVPVISPVSLGVDGQAYNVNADDAAVAIAAALSAQLDLVSDVPGVLVEGNVMPHLLPAEALRLIDVGIARGGMVPKLRAAIRAVEAGVARVRIVDMSGLERGDGGTMVATRGAPQAAADDDSGSDANASRGREASAEELIAIDGRVVLGTYERPPMVIERGEGAWLFDTDGRRYLDFHAGIAVNALGHADPGWVAAVRAQAESLTHVSNLHYTAPAIRLAERLVRASFADSVYLCNSGTEAVEGAIKFARKYHRERLVAEGDRPSRTDRTNDRTAFVAFDRAFHGRTTGSLSMTHKASYREPFLPLLPDVSFAPFNDLAAADRIIDGRTSAVFVEPFQGEGGYRPATLEFLVGLRRLCDERGALLVFDEIQCGLGRTGRMWAYEHYGVTPDLMCIAKPLAGGLPIGAVLLSHAVAASIRPGDHGSTFAGGPLVCAAAEYVVNRVAEPSFLATVRARGEELVAALLALESKRVVDIRGAGLMIGVEFDAPVAPLVVAMRQRNVLTLTAGTHTLRLCPPLIVDGEQIQLFVDTLAACLSEGVLDAAPS